MSYKFKGVFIPANVWTDKRLTPTKKFLLCEIDAMSNGSSEPCYATNSHFAKQFEVHKTTVSGHIKELEEMGYLIISYSNEKTKANRRIHTDLTPMENPYPPMENPNQVNKLLKQPLKKEEEEGEDLFDSQKDFINFCRVNMIGKEFKVANRKYYFNNIGELKSSETDKPLKGGMALAIFEMMFKKQLFFIRYSKQGA